MNVAKKKSTEQKEIPANLEAEKSVLGTVLLISEELHQLVGVLEVDDFWSATHQVIYQSMLEMAEAGSPIDTITLADYLLAKGRMDRISMDGMSGLEYLSYLPDNIPAAANVLHYARIVVEKAQLRSMIQMADNFSRIDNKSDFSRWQDFLQDKTSEFSQRIAALSPKNRQSKPLTRNNYRHFRHNRHFLNFAGVETDKIPLLENRSEVTRFPKTPMDGWFAAVYERSQAPFAQCANACLSVMTLATQHLGVVVTPGMGGDAGHRPLSNFFITIAKSGERKSGVNRIATRGITLAERELEPIYYDELKYYKKKLAQFQIDEKRYLQGDESMSDYPEEPKEPKIPWLTVGDATADGIFHALKVGEYSQGLWTEEGGVLVGGYAMSKDNRRRTAGIFNQLWDGYKLDKPRAGTREQLRGRRFSMHVMIQPGLADDLVNDPLLIEQGLSARFLISEPNSRISQRPWQQASLKSVEICDRFDEYICNLIKMQGRYNAAEDGLDPRPIYLSDEARPVWVDFYNEIERDILEKYQSVIGFAAKTGEHALRLAGVLALFENPETREIALPVLEVGIALARYYLAEQLRLQEGRPTAEIEQANILKDWLENKWPESEKFVSLADICRGPRKLRKKKDAEEAVYTLVEHGYLEVWHQPEMVRGKKRNQVFRIKRGESGDSKPET